MKTNELILILGGTGKTGRRITERLNARSIPVRSAARSTAPAFDWNDSRTWSPVLNGVTTVYINYSPDLAVPGAAESIQGFVDAAVAHGVRRLVLLSGRGEKVAEQCEHIVQDAGIEWTVLRASWFNQNFSEGEFVDLVLDGTLALPAANIAEPFIDVDDIVDVAVAALTETGHHGEIYELSGPRLLTFADAAAEITRASGRDVAYVPISHEAFRTGLTASGAPADMVWLLDYLFTTVLDGRNATLCDGVQRALGRVPKDFSDFAREVAATGLWQPDIRQTATH